MDTSYPSPSQPLVQNQSEPSANTNIATPRSATSPISGNGWHFPVVSTLADLRGSTQSRAFYQQKYDLTNGLTMGPERLGLDFLLDGSQRVSKVPNGLNGSCSPAYHDQTRHEGSVSVQQGRNSRGNGMSQMEYSINDTVPELAAHSAPIRNGPPTW